MATHIDKNKSNYWYWYNNISIEISAKQEITTCREEEKKGAAQFKRIILRSKPTSNLFLVLCLFRRSPISIF
jgi:hypothetical protein